MSLRIDNRDYARSGLIFGRILPFVVGASCLWTLVSLVFSGLSYATAVPIVINILLIVIMGALFARRGRHPAVFSLELETDQFNVEYSSHTITYRLNQIRDMQYEGVHNRSRVKVSSAPFPPDGVRILVITLSNGTELRVRVRHEHDQPLKQVAARPCAG